MKINLLPIEIITLILLNVCKNTSKYLINLSIVCKKWRSIVWKNEYFYLTLLKQNYLEPIHFFQQHLLQSIIIKHNYYIIY